MRLTISSMTWLLNVTCNGMAAVMCSECAIVYEATKIFYIFIYVVFPSYRLIFHIEYVSKPYRDKNYEGPF